ncbi:protein-L-isoaspartate O-methyltransferase family protein [Neisseria wadsworthii]|uniref:Protein-L-isoaspartate O-methyltransferase n=1 Tax=Neisseria wadsworthii 9715 TaxID=1030841 RepID=G4CT15_9NEIS|nr:protein-L-isoaspartate O-methyltransferase [Neisseria wadsworthii]EGZ44377.1 protein-L-isoaspartate(D-aspartate) O-methyltransferase [Neisseria wadsworthii 9715]QMT35824.1 protein-L-isoaspartate O-methyltransferase [Neisseria wadsworthii]
MDFQKARFNMVEQQIRPWDVLDFDVLDALDAIPREEFVTEEQKPYAYADVCLPLPNGGKMLEPRIVARLIQGLALKKGDNVLEIGTGSGYATALLATLAEQVVSIDMDAGQQTLAKAALDKIGLTNIIYQNGDGLAGQVGGAPFDAIYVGGSVPDVPEVLKSQLKDGGRLVVIVGGSPVQHALQITRNGDEYTSFTLFDTSVTGLQAPTVAKPSKFHF